MRTTLFLLLGLLFSTVTIAQRGINYKAVIKDASSNVVDNQLIDVQFTILKTTSSGTTVYQESHAPTTDDDGLIIINIGEGTPITGTFNGIDWGSDDHFLNVQVDIGAGLVDMGTTEFKSVPYALNVTGLEKITEGSNTGWRLEVNPIVDGGIVANIGQFALDLAIHDDGHFPTSFVGASGDYSLAAGLDNWASGNFSNAFGHTSLASGNYSFTSGLSNVASGNYSTTMGNGLSADAINSFVIGRHNIGGGNPTTWVATDPLFQIGNGTISTPSNALNVLKNGSITAPSFTTALINTAGAKALVTKEYVEGSVTGLEKITEGSNTGWRLIGRNPANFGDIGNDAVDFSKGSFGDSGALGTNSVAFGNNTYAGGGNSIASGIETAANGSGSFAGGFDSVAGGTYSIAFGNNAITSASNAVAFGDETRAIGSNSFAVGSLTEASGSASAAFGSSSIASGSNSFAAGISVASGSNTFAAVAGSASGLNSAAFNLSKSEAFGSFSIGINNVGGGSATTWVASDPLFQIGNGYLSAPSNAFEVKKNGDVYASGALVHSSDRRLKSDIAMLKYGLEEVLALTPVAYYWKNRPHQDYQSFGLIAQEVQPIIEEIVHQSNPKNDLLSVSYTELIPVLIKAIQEQHAIIVNQKKTNNQQTKLLEKLNTGIQTLTDRIDALETLNNREP